MRVQTWYGLSGAIELEDDAWHLIEVGGARLPHPALVNVFLRRGLPRWQRRRLSFLHELGHLQTFPVVMGYTVLAILAGTPPGRSFRERIGWCTRLGVAHQAVAEMAAEAYVMSRESRSYRNAYRDRPHRPLVFWAAMTGIAIGVGQSLFRGRG